MKAVLAAVLLCSTLEAHAQGKLADVAVIDRDRGTTLPTYYHAGEYWVAGTPGAKYAVEIRNRLGERVLAVTAVDGINVVSGETAAWNQTGYVFTPGERYEITGWRKSDADVAAFAFTALPNSYAARTGRPANVGVIGVALFRERQPEPRFYGGANSPAPAPPGYGAQAREESANAAALGGLGSRAADATAALPAAKLGTAHGERESSVVSHTDFERLQNEPNEVIRIRYDSLDNLVAMGIVPRRPPISHLPNPFPGSPDSRYVPDPPG